MKRIFNKDSNEWDLIPSENYGPNKMLVSDTDGNPRWEDKSKLFEGLFGGGITEEEVIDILIEANMLPTLIDSTGKILTDNSGKIILG